MIRLDRQACWGTRATFSAVVCFTSALLFPRLAHAEDAVDLTWDAPPGCPQANAVRERLRSLRGARSRPSQLRAEGRIVRVDGRYRLTLGVHEGAQVLERKIDAQSCKDLAGAAAVALALLLRDEESRESAAKAGPRPETNPSDPARASTSVEPSTPTPPPEAEPPPPEPKPEPPPPTPVVRPEPADRDVTPSGPPRSWRLLLRPLASVDVGPLPSPNPSLGVGLGWSWKRWSALLVGRKSWPATVTRSGPPVTYDGPTDVNAEFERLMLELWACRDFRAGALDAGPCLAVSGQRIAASGGGFAVTSSPEHTVTLNLGAGLSARLHLSEWLALAANAHALLATSRPRFVIDEAGQVYQFGLASLSLGLGLELSL